MINFGLLIISNSIEDSIKYEELLKNYKNEYRYIDNEFCHNKSKSIEIPLGFREHIDNNLNCLNLNSRYVSLSHHLSPFDITLLLFNGAISYIEDIDNLSDTLNESIIYQKNNAILFRKTYFSIDYFNAYSYFNEKWKCLNRIFNECNSNNLEEYAYYAVNNFDIKPLLCLENISNINEQDKKLKPIKIKRIINDDTC